MKEELKSKIFQALGEVSMCWLPNTGNLEFDSTRAVEIGNKLCEEIEKELNEKVN